MKCIYNGKILHDGAVIEGMAILFEDKIISIVPEEEGLKQATDKIDAKGNYIAPGFIDIHIHGYLGYDTMDGNVESIQKISEGICGNGVTSFLPTTMTMSKEHIIAALESVRVAKKMDIKGAEILGVHMEGPYISETFKGAQNPEYIVRPSKEDVSFVKSYGDIVKHITIAPEIEGAKQFITTIHEDTDITLSMGHSAAGFKEAMEGIACGVSHATHLFNGMSPLHHREPGVVGAALTSDISCEAICDTIHVNKGLFPFLIKTKGIDKFVLVTDCMSAGGMYDGDYELGGQKVILKEGAVRLESGSLAGSVLTLNKALKNVMDETGLPIENAIKLVTINPATTIKVSDFKGTLDCGKDADIIVLDKDINVKMTINRGMKIYENI